MASSSSSSASPYAPALSSKWWKYDVFLSFRGEDTRNTFVGHLYSALEQEEKRLLNTSWRIKPRLNLGEKHSWMQVTFLDGNPSTLPMGMKQKNLVGMAARLQGLKLELKIGSGGVRMVGIWGVGGGENIREESGRYGLGKLKDKILSELGVNRGGGGRSLINYRFLHRKVLIVLDDVDQPDQLKALAGSCDWFGEGSRIIITTRDEHVLTAHKVDVIHNISLLNNDEAMKLFCKHSLWDNRAMEDYEHLAKEVVSYAGGLPLALTVLSSFLCDKDINEWKSALVRLKEIPDTDIVEKLKISFDGLKPVEKDLFLDIACFFRWEYKDEAMKILDACGFHPVIGVKVLIQKALITISNGKFDMHDLVQEMGHYIVRGEHPNNPEKHSRVWKKEYVLSICAMDGMVKLDNTGAINFRHVALDKSQSFLQAVANMNKLRWIDLYVDQINEITRPLPEHFVMSHDLGENFPPRELCCLRLANLMQKQLWEGYKLLPNLKIMELYRLLNLRMTPDFSGLPNLERFNLTLCWYLEEIHPSLDARKGSLSYLYQVVLLSDLPSSIAVVIADECWSLESFGDISNCKWLWKVSLKGNNKVGPLFGDILLHSMLQGNAIEDHFVSFTLPYQIPKRFVGRLFRGKTFTMHLPKDWYNDFCGFLICSVHGMYHPCIDISIKQEPKYDGRTMENRCELWLESNEVLEPSYDGKTTFIGYVSFG
ncbi:unnamed protein product [Lactuca virosa]|uniref:TIR domain-containing protein n=1 Tax=Lactuca virosa TaxID=75947 RepID=A0AAU9NCB7_9ASTR|nr:unnamed protein product [Lactuca virosa]